MDKPRVLVDEKELHEVVAITDNYDYNGNHTGGKGNGNIDNFPGGSGYGDGMGNGSDSIDGGYG